MTEKQIAKPGMTNAQLIKAWENQDRSQREQLLLEAENLKIKTRDEESKTILHIKKQEFNSRKEIRKKESDLIAEQKVELKDAENRTRKIHASKESDEREAIYTKMCEEIKSINDGFVVPENISIVASIPEEVIASNLAFDDCDNSDNNLLSDVGAKRRFSNDFDGFDNCESSELHSTQAAALNNNEQSGHYAMNITESRKSLGQNSTQRR